MNDSTHIPFTTLMADIHRMFSTSLYRQLKADGINLSRSQWRILTHLRTQDGLTQSELAERLLIEKAPAGTLIDKLEAAGLVERRPDPNDRRANRVFITVKSEPLLPMIEQTVTELKMQCMAGISEQEQQQLNQTLTRIHLNLQAIRNPNATTEETG